MKRLILLTLALLPIFVYGQRPVVARLGDWVDDSVQLKGPMQGLAVYGRYAVTLRHGGQCLLLDLRKKRCIAAFQLEGNATHCNNASFSSEFLKDTGASPTLPLLYVSSCYGDKACHVTRIDTQGSTTVQRIYFDSPSFPVAQDWCLDADSGYLYAFGGRKGGMMYLKKFVLPSVTTETTEVHLTDADVIRTIPITCVKVAQGSKIKEGHAYLPDGDSPGNYWLHVVDLDTGQEVRTIDLNPIGLEPEGVDVRGRWIYVSFNTPDPKENKIYRFRR
ncbi:MAG: hypothetical protein IKG81_08885 [Bacteroidales bacterium]|nr:hypothetical protein [Bacteroidales bacterium]